MENAEGTPATPKPVVIIQLAIRVRVISIARRVFAATAIVATLHAPAPVSHARRLKKDPAPMAHAAPFLLETIPSTNALGPSVALAQYAPRFLAAMVALARRRFARVGIAWATSCKS
jgi:hypothetical protein